MAIQTKMGAGMSSSSASTLADMTSGGAAAPVSRTHDGPLAIEARNMNIYYGSFHAVRDVNLQVEPRKITALIGPSGCGKSTVLRSFNRMNDLVASARVEGEVLFNGRNIYAPEVDAVEVRRRIGMVFQKPNPFPKSIHVNAAWGAKVNGRNGEMDALDEQSLLHGRRKGGVK